ncbi:GAF and ANTAR domain-containing protein [Streptomyces sp. 21So2-11]|uniref:GAF and ANTAR domain-containing protein n=1 Tax=Streptomyces sp. 21So2-11 TaxID=3144408 RepID=UPI00321B10DC
MEWAHRWVEASAELAGMITAEREVPGFLQGFCERSVELLDVPAVATILVDADSCGIRFAIASDENARLLSLVAADRQEGPVFDCLRSGKPLYAIDLLECGERWPDFSARALAFGIDKTAALPLRRGEELLGAWQVFGRERLPDRAALDLAQQLADIAVLALSHSLALREATESAEGLRAALTSRVRIEQAKGILAARWDVHPDVAFQSLRAYARSRQRKLHEVAHEVVERQLDFPR